MNLKRLGIVASLLAAAMASVQAQAADLGTTFQDILGASEVHDTKIRMIADNADAWKARWAMIERAKESIDVTYFVFKDDIFGRSLLGLLRKKAQQGIKIRLMVDAFGASPIVKQGGAFLSAFESHENVEVRVFNPKLRLPRTVKNLVQEVVAANHDKILLIDGYLCMTGGRNIGSHYFATEADGFHTFRDTDVLLEGRGIAAQMKTAFEEEFDRRESFEHRPKSWKIWKKVDLEMARREINMAYHVMRRWLVGGDLPTPTPSEFSEMLTRLHDEVRAHKALHGGLSEFWGRLWEGHRAYPTQILDKHSTFGPKNQITTGMVQLFDAAQESIYLQNAYVVLTPEIYQALVRASKRGVKIVIHTNSPETSNQPTTVAFFAKEWVKMVQDMPTLQLYAYQGHQTLHAKTFVVDDAIASIGSYNLDPLSQNINSEIVAVTHSKAFALRNRLRIEKDLEESVEYKLEVGRDGSVKVLRGPDQDLGKKALRTLKILRSIPGLRNFI